MSFGRLEKFKTFPLLSGAPTMTLIKPYKNKHQKNDNNN